METWLLLLAAIFLPLWFFYIRLLRIEELYNVVVKEIKRKDKIIEDQKRTIDALKA